MLVWVFTSCGCEQGCAGAWFRRAHARARVGAVQVHTHLHFTRTRTNPRMPQTPALALLRAHARRKTRAPTLARPKTRAPAPTLFEAHIARVFIVSDSEVNGLPKFAFVGHLVVPDLYNNLRLDPVRFFVGARLFCKR